MAWILLLIAGLLEVVWAYTMKLSQGFTRTGATIATLLAMLRLQQPNNHDFAYLILKAISGQSYGERDYSAWEAWLRAQQVVPSSAAP